ncbi:MAG: PH domain-containing protein [Opitutus sp.]
MFEPLRRRALILLKVPPEPHPPVGDPASLRVFHAGRNYFRLRLGAWAFTQLIALAGIIFWAALLIEVEKTTRTQPLNPPTPAAAPIPPAASTTPAAPVDPKPEKVVKTRRPNWVERFSHNVEAANRSGSLRGWTGFKRVLIELALLMPAWVFPAVWALKLLGFAIYLLQIPITYAVRRLDYEMRWYMVTDRSLRLRHGIWNVSESTMSFANIQQVVVTHGPLQGLLGLGDVKVQSAGGGGGEKHQARENDMHRGLFHSVTNAAEIRDLILERLRRFRESGLGDPDEPANAQPLPLTAPPVDALAAARELLAEARALRTAVN